jgi:hypothetical protein
MSLPPGNDPQDYDNYIAGQDHKELGIVRARISVEEGTTVFMGRPTNTLRRILVNAETGERIPREEILRYQAEHRGSTSGKGGRGRASAPDYLCSGQVRLQKGLDSRHL